VIHVSEPLDVEEFFRQGDEGSYEGGPAQSLAALELPLVETAELRPTAAQLVRRARNQRRVAFLMTGLAVACVPLFYRYVGPLDASKGEASGAIISYQAIELPEIEPATPASDEPLRSVAETDTTPTRLVDVRAVESTDEAEPPRPVRARASPRAPILRRAPTQPSAPPSHPVAKRALAPRIVTAIRSVPSGGAPPTARFAD
jgi:hypothetical protein